MGLKKQSKCVRSVNIVLIRGFKISNYYPEGPESGLKREMKSDLLLIHINKQAWEKTPQLQQSQTWACSPSTEQAAEWAGFGESLVMMDVRKLTVPTVVFRSLL